MWRSCRLNTGSLNLLNMKNLGFPAIALVVLVANCFTLLHTHAQPSWINDGLLRHFGFEDSTEEWSLSTVGATRGSFENRTCLKFEDGGWANWERALNQVVPTNPQSFSQCIWVYTTSSDASGYLLQRRQQTESSGCSGLPSWMVLSMQGSDVVATVDAPCWGNESGRFAASLGSWHAFVYSRNGSEVRFYADGVLLSQKADGFTSNNSWNEFNGSDRDYTIGK